MCTNELESDVIVEIGEMSFHLHKVLFLRFFSSLIFHVQEMFISVLEQNF